MRSTVGVASSPDVRRVATDARAPGLQLRLRRACEADGPRMLELLTRHGHRVVPEPRVAIVALIGGEIVAVAVGSSRSCAADADLALEPQWVGQGLGAAMGRALGEALCAAGSRRSDRP
jgi:hypothetical protein